MMQKRFIVLVFLLLALLSSVACGPTEKLGKKDNTLFSTGSRMYMTTNTYTNYQLDSMCVVDTLPKDLNQWVKGTYTDFETNAYIIRYMYIKELAIDYEITYIVTPRQDIYIVQKRRVIKEK